MRWTILAASGLALAACSSKDSGGNTTSAAGSSQAEAPANLTADPNNMAVPVALPSPTALTAIPAAFQGRWGLVGADCDRAKADAAKGLMVIAGSRLTFYESRGDTADLRQVGPDRLSFTLAMSGEGQRWSEPTLLTVMDAGRTLVRQARGTGDRAGAFTYQKCPA